MAGPFSNADGFVPFLSDDNIARLSGYDPAASLYVQGGRDNRYFNHQSLEAGEGRMDVEVSSPRFNTSIIPVMDLLRPRSIG